MGLPILINASPTGNRMKKTTSPTPLLHRLLAATLALLFLLSACQPLTPAEQTVEAQHQTEQASQPTPTRPAAPQPTPTRPSYLEIDLESLKGLTIRFWHPWTGSLAAEANRLVDEFNRTNVWGFQVQAVSTGGSMALFNQMEQTLRAESQRPNLIAAPADQVHLWQRKFNAVVSLDAYLNDAEWGMPTEEQAAYLPLFWQQDQVSGRQIAIPALRDAHLLAFNISWAKDLGFSQPPSTPKDFQEQVCAAAQARGQAANDGTGGWITSSDPYVLLSWLNAFGWDGLDDLQRDQAEFNTPRSQEALAYLRGLFNRGCAWNSRLPDPYEYFANRQALAYSLTLSQASLQAETLERLQSKDQWMLLPYPAQAAGSVPSFFTSGDSYAMLVASPQEQLAAWLFMRWMSNPRSQASLAQAGGLLPVTTTAAEQMTLYARQHPGWQQAYDLIAAAQPAPNAAAWPYTSLVLSDAAWQTWQGEMDEEKLNQILFQIDATLPEIYNLVP